MRYRGSRPPHHQADKDKFYPKSVLYWRRRLRYVYLRFLRLQGTPKAIARGLAAGAFTGMFPFFGLQIILGVLLAAAVRGNKLAAAAATWISNPFTYIPLFTFNFRVGRTLLNTPALPFAQLDVMGPQQWFSLGTDLLVTLLVGCVVVGIIAATVTYFGGLWLIEYLRRHPRRPSR
ncbi:DUF2062 domain-containing protein [Synechococcales cyanobacterium C]|uniref:DUF2062 domain-containing protein n=2 Tax=Petrachloros TaxID=2918834 RepID=A0A8K1ZX68_9CYAN|nr:DUF2062 domain-containing protein [Petrachloros mirabilis ULC683]